MQKFRFECTKNQEDDFPGSIEYPINSFTVHEFEMSDDCVWDSIMEQFARFLDMVGYVGVYQAHMENETRLEKLLNAVLEKQNADTSNEV
jgi:hypothetical protein